MNYIMIEASITGPVRYKTIDLDSRLLYNTLDSVNDTIQHDVSQFTNELERSGRYSTSNVTLTSPEVVVNKFTAFLELTTGLRAVVTHFVNIEGIDYVKLATWTKQEDGTFQMQLEEQYAIVLERAKFIEDDRITEEIEGVHEMF